MIWKTLGLLSFGLAIALEAWALAALSRIPSGAFPVNAETLAAHGLGLACGAWPLLAWWPGHRGRGRRAVFPLFLALCLPVPLVGLIFMGAFRLALGIQPRRQSNVRYVLEDRGALVQARNQAVTLDHPQSVLEILSGNNESLRRTAILALRNVDARKSLPLLQKAIQDSDEQVRLLAQTLFNRILSNLETAVKRMESRLAPERSRHATSPPLPSGRANVPPGEGAGQFIHREPEALPTRPRASNSTAEEDQAGARPEAGGDLDALHGAEPISPASSIHQRVILAEHYHELVYLGVSSPETERLYLDRAAQLLDEALSEEPGHNAARFLRLKCSVKSGRLSEAKNAVEVLRGSGFPPHAIAPWEAEIHFLERDWPGLVGSLRAVAASPALDPRLRHLLDFWLQPGGAGKAGA